MNKKVIFMGTPQIATTCLQALVNAGFDVPLVLSQPDMPKGRGGKVQFTPVKELALSLGIEVYQPQRFKDNQEAYEKLSAHNPDFFAVVAYGKILPQVILDIPRFAPINVHFSVLPRYRGAAPVNWAIMNGDNHSGVTTMCMDAGMDTGNILLMEKTLIGRKDAVELAEELSAAGADLLIKTLKEFENIIPCVQNEKHATYAPLMQKQTGLINWAKTADEIERMPRAFVPWPCAYTYLDGKIIKIFDVIADPGADAPIGIVYSVNKRSFSVGTGQGGLIINELQLEGKKRMSTADFLAGFKLTTGVALG